MDVLNDKVDAGGIFKFILLGGYPIEDYESL
jgi:hypothetical protein